MIAALQGMAAASQPRGTKEDAEPSERPFKIESSDFPSLMIDLLNAAISASAINHERYEDVKFTLITDTKAEGAFIGRPVKGFGTEIKAATHRDLFVQKNEQGEWETTVLFDAKK